METVLELRGVTKKFDRRLAVDDVTLAVRRGELHSLLGPSGCGKTTILRMVAGFETPDAGGIFLNGERINHRRPFERNVSTVFQSYALFPHLTVRENVEFGPKRHGLPDAAERAQRVLEMVRMTDYQKCYPAHLSGGERQRVALARSIALEPEVLLLDEPLSALDPNLRKQVRGELRTLQRRTGITFLMVTHDQEEAVSMSDRITVLHDGRVEQIGGPEDVYLRPRTRFVADFLGAVNWINGVGVRPESTRISYQPPGNGARFLPARVEGATFLGDCIHVETCLSSGERLIAQVPRWASTFRTGEAVHVWWNPGDELAFPHDRA